MNGIKNYRNVDIWGVNAPVGSGKSSTSNKMIEPKDKTLIAMPTREATDETTQNYSDFHGHDALKIYSRDKEFPDGVDKPSEHLVNAMKNGVNQIRTTHESLFRIGQVLEASEYKLIVDESPAVSHFYNENLSDLTKIDDLYVKTGEYQEYTEVDKDGKELTDSKGNPVVSRSYKVTANPEANDRIQRYLTEGNPINKHKNFYSQVSNTIYKMLQYLDDDNFECWIPDTFGTYNERTKKVDYNFRMLSILKPSFFNQFKSVEVLSAELDSTEFYIIYEALGVNFTEEELKGLRYTELVNQDITFHYQRDLVNYSKNQKNRKNKSGERFGDLLIQGIKDYVYSDSSIDNKLYFTGNSADRDTYKKVLGEDALQTTTRVNSLNNLQDYNTIIYPVCMNLSPFERAVYKRLGIDADRIERSRNILNAYQYIRGGNRKEISEHVDVFVPSEFMAKELQNLFGDSSVKECEFMTDKQLMSFVDVDKRKQNGGNRKGSGQKAKWIKEVPRGTKRDRVKKYIAVMGLTTIPSPENQKEILDEVGHLNNKDFKELIERLKQSGNNGLNGDE